MIVDSLTKANQQLVFKKSNLGLRLTNGSVMILQGTEQGVGILWAAHDIPIFPSTTNTEQNHLYPRHTIPYEPFH